MHETDTRLPNARTYLIAEPLHIALLRLCKGDPHKVVHFLAQRPNEVLTASTVSPLCVGKGVTWQAELTCFAREFGSDRLPALSPKAAGTSQSAHQPCLLPCETGTGFIE